MPLRQIDRQQPLEQASSSACTFSHIFKKNEKVLRLARQEYSRQIIKYTINHISNEFSNEELQKCYTMI
ncbi:unnamed protein product [Cunninghamella echinulata]